MGGPYKSVISHLKFRKTYNKAIQGNLLLLNFYRVMKAARLDHGRPVPIGVAMRSWADTSKKTVKANREGSQQ